SRMTEENGMRIIAIRTSTATHVGARAATKTQRPMRITNARRESRMVSTMSITATAVSLLVVAMPLRHYQGQTGITSIAEIMELLRELDPQGCRGTAKAQLCLWHHSLLP